MKYVLVIVVAFGLGFAGHRLMSCQHGKTGKTQQYECLRTFDNPAGLPEAEFKAFSVKANALLDKRMLEQKLDSSPYRVVVYKELNPARQLGASSEIFSLGILFRQGLGPVPEPIREELREYALECFQASTLDHQKRKAAVPPTDKAGK